MKKIFMLAALALAGFVPTSCEYDDGDLWNAVEDVQDRVSRLEQAVENANNDLSTLQTLVEALRNQVSVVSVDETADGYAITFSDGKTATISNGKDGANAPAISVRQDADGLYYWTLDGEWMLVDGRKVRASAVDGAAGQDAVAPRVRIADDTKQWEISTDGGLTWTSTGVTAEGKDGSSGDSYFQEVDQSDDRYVTFVLNDGSQIRLERYDASAPTFVIAGVSGVQTLKFGTTKEYAVEAANVADFSISKPDGWRATYADGTLRVTAPVAGNAYAETEGVIAVNLVSASGKGLIVKMPVQAAAYELRVLTFEDADAKFDAYTLDYAGVTVSTWSDLIEKDQQYGGPLLYGPSFSAQYWWFDDNNTYLFHEFPDGMMGQAYWGGGHAISNYSDMDLSHGDFNHQLAVYYSHPVTGKGGHNGSDNFCMQYGYRDYTGMISSTLPSLEFADGVARVIDHMWVTNSTYAANCYLSGNGLTAAIGPDDWVKLVATGYDVDGNEAGVSEFYLCNGPEYIVTEWAKWDLSSLGEVAKVEFNVTGSSDNGYGFSQPAYFAYDDVAVRF